MSANVIDDVLTRHGYDGTRLMHILREVQDALGWLSPQTLTAVAQGVRRPRAHVARTAEFYTFFNTRPVGDYRVLFSDNITDRFHGSLELRDQLCTRLALRPGRVAEDGLASVDLTSCTGLSDQGPAALVNYRAVTRLTPQRIDEMAGLIRARTPLSDWPSEWFTVETNIRRKDQLLGNTVKPGEAIAAALRRGPEGVLSELSAAALRGRGGAGFNTATKWRVCRDAPGYAHYVVGNADEGEPGTFKDRVLLTRCPDMVFEGMTLCARVIGARRGFVYLRGEYRYLLEPLNRVLAGRREQNLLGQSILGVAGFDFDIEIHLGAGAYICGEESALIESLEGKRGTPRNRPPFPVTNGYLDQPTIVNNVETFAAAALIALNGGEWYASVGTRHSAGTKILSVSGDCERPGLYEYPFGVSIRQVLADCGAQDVQAVQVSGPSGICLSPAEFERTIGFEDIPTAGAFTIFNNSRDMFEVARNYVHFFQHESCGFCTPCRVGTSLLKNLMDKLHNGCGSPYDFAEIEKLNQLLQSMSHCGLGHTACNPVLDTIARFRPAYERRLAQKDFVPAFDLDQALAAARQMTGRDDPGAHIIKEEFGEDA